MGFPVGYTEVFLPKIFIHLLTFLGLIRSILQSFFNFIGLPDFLEPSEIRDYSESPTSTTTTMMMPVIPPISALLIRELLPVVKYSSSSDCCSAAGGGGGGGEEVEERCTVCLYEFEDGEEIRWLNNCRHIFHRRCIDRWMDYDQKNCPLCRTALVPRDLQDEFNQRLWAATARANGLDDDDDDYHNDFNISHM